MQIALVLSDKVKSLSVIKMFSDYSFGVSNLVWNFFLKAGSIYPCSTSSTQVSLVSLSFLSLVYVLCLRSVSACKFTLALVSLPPLAHVRSVSMKSQSVTTILFEW